jgi:hypothetical protein
LPHKLAATWEARMDSLAARHRMVDGQVRPSDVTDLRLLTAMLEIPRERFVPAEQKELAYADFEIPLRAASADSPARRLLRPRNLAKLIQALDLGAEDSALVVGCASGYGAALVARRSAHVRLGGGRAARRRLEGEGALRRDSARGCDRNPAARPLRPAQRARTPGVHPGARAGRPRHGLPRRERRRERPGGIRCRRTRPARVRGAACLRFLACGGLAGTVARMRHWKSFVVPHRCRGFKRCPGRVNFAMGRRASDNMAASAREAACGRMV